MTQSRLLPILFTLNNTDSIRDTIMLVFSFIIILLNAEESTANSVLKRIDIFTIEEIQLLNDRIINARNKVVGMNEKHLVIFFGVLYMIVKMLNMEPEVHILKDDEEDMQNFFLPEIQEKFIKRANQFISEIKSKYTKNHYIARSIAKINTC